MTTRQHLASTSGRCAHQSTRRQASDPFLDWHLLQSWQRASSRRFKTTQHELRRRLSQLDGRVHAFRGDEEIDVAVFRFTLGVPGFDDALIPRAVGIMGSILLASNHIAGAGNETSAQAIAEALGFLLAVACMAAPSVDARLQEARPGRGRRSTPDTAPGCKPVFAMSGRFSEAAKQELAWASYALLRNTNSCSVVCMHDGEAVLARGAIREDITEAGSAKEILQCVARGVREAASTSAVMQEVLSAASPSAYLPDPAALRGAGATGWSFLPTGAGSALLQALLPAALESDPGQSATLGSAGGQSGKGPPPGALILVSDRPRALSQRERLWVAALAAKLAGAFSSQCITA